MYEVTNSSRSERILYDAAGRPRPVRAGETITIDASDKAMKRFRRDKLLKFKQLGDEPAQPPAGGGQTTTVHEETPRTRSQESQAIVAELDAGTIDYPTASVRAKTLLGNDWPGGTPKKSALMDLLARVQD